MMEGTRAVTARSVRSATQEVYVGLPDRTPGATGRLGRAARPDPHTSLARAVPAQRVT
jgi:hypothetical protein